MTTPTPRPEHQVPLPDAVAEDTSTATGSDDRPTEQDWLAAADHVGNRDRELLNRLGQ